MRFIKRFVFIILLLFIAFFIYRLISPSGANELLFSLKSVSNNSIGTHFSLVETASPSSGNDDVSFSSGDLSMFFESGSEDLTSDEELLFNEEWLFQDNSGSELSSGSSLTGTVSVDVTVVQTGSSAPSPSSASKSPSAQELRDLRNILKNFDN